MKTVLLFIFSSFVLSSCSNGRNTINFVGNSATRGFCGQSGKIYENPFPNEFNDKVFEEVNDEDILPEKYRAKSVSILFKNNSGEDENVVYNHAPVFNKDELSLEAFSKDCSRGLIFESSKAQFNASLPVEITFRSSTDWVTNKALDYELKYGKEFKDDGFIVGKVLENSSPNPSSEKADYLSSSILKPLDKSKLKSKEVKEDVEVLTFDEYKKLFPALSNDFKVNVNIKDKYNKYLSSMKSSSSDPNKIASPASKEVKDIFIQIQVSSNPDIYARILFNKYIPPSIKGDRP